LLDTNAQRTVQRLLQSHELLKKDILDKIILIIQSNKEQHSESCSRLLFVAENQILAIQNRLIRSLRFGAMDERLGGIEDAHRKTFEWIFLENPSRRRIWDNFVDWLQAGSGVYWINGKAGSGKSTLMRFILESPQTSRLLDVWSQGSNIKVGGFFFWKSGKILQRTQNGLFRSLLYEALKEQPELVPLIFPGEWSSAKASIARGDAVVHTLDFQWSLKELQKAFARLATFATESMKFCFFIDGLDEYEGDKDRLAEFCKTLSASPHLKLCISSRPWLVFEDAFKQYPGLKLQDLTFDDVVTYVRDVLEEHPRMLQLTRASQEHATELITEIVEKANGVYLWVKLVVRSLLQGLQNRDEILDLRRRVRNLPDDLASLYTVMLYQVEPMYRQQASQIFQVYHAMVTVEGSKANISPLDLELGITATSEVALSSKLKLIDKNEIFSRCERMDALLKSRCAGLLEVSRSFTHEGNGGTNEPTPLWTSSRVGYLHSTVKEFLETEEVRNILFADTASMTEFEPYTSVLMSYIIKLKRSLQPPSNPLEWPTYGRDGLWKAKDFALEYAANAALSHTLAYIPLLDELDKTLSKLWLRDDNTWNEYLRGVWPELEVSEEHLKWQSNLLTTIVGMGLCSYVQEKLKMNKTLLSERSGRPLLSYALVKDVLCSTISIEMVEILLVYGADPNQLWEGNTPWQEFLTSLHSLASSVYDYTVPANLGNYHSTMVETAKIFKLLLQYGANPYSTCTHNHSLPRNSGARGSRHVVEDVITDAFKYLPYEAAELSYILHIQMDSRLELALETNSTCFGYNQTIPSSARTTHFSSLAFFSE
jgi:hypothetical protein